ncbi:MAG TPA: hypothetical protein VGG44_10620 [Tepidisphaeraceae bacterium]
MYVHDRKKLAKAMGLDYLVAGLVGQTFGAILIGIAGELDPTAPGILGALLFVIGTGVLFGGCAMFARFHRLSRWTFLLGFLSIVGVSILLMLPPVSRRRNRGEGFDVLFAEPYRRDVWRMDIKVILDQALAPAIRDPIMLQLPRGANVGAALKTLAGVIPELDLTQSPHERFTINAEPADRRSELSHGDELTIAATIPSGAHT